jgi:hypothetical protein
VIRARLVAATVDLSNPMSQMTRTRPISFLASAAVVALGPVLATGCGGGRAATAARPKTSSGASAAVGVAKSGLGSIPVDSTGAGNQISARPVTAGGSYGY